MPQHVTIVAPFSVPASLDPRVLAHIGRREARARIAARLEGSGHGAVWGGTGPRVQRYHDFSAELAGRLRDASPQWIAMQAPDATLDQVCRLGTGISDPTVTFHGHHLTLELRAAELGIMDAGFGSVLLDYAVVDDSASATSDADCLDDGTAVTSLIHHLRPVIEEAGQAFVAAIPDDMALAIHIDRFHRTSRPQCLWGHDILTFPNDDVDHIVERLGDTAPTAEMGQRSRATYRDSTLVPGLGTSLLVGARDERVPVTRWMSLAQAYYAAIASIERLVSIQGAGGVDPGEKPDIGRDRDHLAILTQYRSVLTTLDIHLAASTSAETRLWAVATRVWRMDRLLGAIDTGLADLRQRIERSDADRAAARAHLFTVVALLFTIITVLSTFFDLVDFSQGVPFRRPDQWRLVVEVSLLLLIGGAAYVILRRDH